MESPYKNSPVDKWESITSELIKKHPLKVDNIVEAVLESWKDIFATKIADRYLIGSDIFPKPQIMGFFLHELIPLRLAEMEPQKWRVDSEKKDKDVVCVENEDYSIEIKTSSNKDQVFGNRSYGKKRDACCSKKEKSKSGYYLLVNFEKFSSKVKKPKIRMIRFGWIDQDDWRSQSAETGQQSRLDSDVYKGKMQIIYQAN